jgi:hypothetical protein
LRRRAHAGSHVTNERFGWLLRWIPRPDPLVTEEAPSRRAVLLLSGIVLVHLLLAWLSRQPGLAWGEDDAAYIFLARELRHFSYREIQDITAPWHARFPPGYPLLIALFGLPFGDAVDALQGMSAVFSGATIVLLFLTARRHLGDATALVLAGLLAINPMTIRDGGLVMAEAAFKLCLALGLWALSYEKEGNRYSVLAAGAMIFGALTRSAGITLVFALFLYWVLRQRYRHAALLVVVSLATVGAWMGWTIMAPDAEYHRLYTADLGIAGPKRSVIETIYSMIAPIVERLPRRVPNLATEVFPFVIAVPVIAGTVIDNAAWLVVSFVCGLTGTVVLLRRWTPAALVTICYTMLLVVWRYAVVRFASPLAPFLHAAVFVGAEALLKRLAPRARVPVLTGLVLLLVIGALREGVPRLNAAMQCDRSNPIDAPGCWDSQNQAYLAAARWVRASTPEDATFFVNKERSFYYHSARRTINQDRALEEDSLSLGPYLRSRGAAYTVATSIGVKSGTHNRLLAQACREFVVLKEFPEETVVLRLRQAGEAPGDDAACRVLFPYRDRSRSDE